ncbi:UDP binding domain-containing protein, partial [Hyphomicrobium sp.]|uniref:UDP binding domain-containing protein n=1 Tax=Hyphomicrobium sp. TaxID=82 RepID=UPI002C6D8A25
ADILVVLTEWNEYRALDLQTIKSQMAGNTIIDLRNVLDPTAVQAFGIGYSGVGRRTSRRTL